MRFTNVTEATVSGDHVVSVYPGDAEARTAWAPRHVRFEGTACPVLSAVYLPGRGATLAAHAVIFPHPEPFDPARPFVVATLVHGDDQRRAPGDRDYLLDGEYDLDLAHALAALLFRAG